LFAPSKTPAPLVQLLHKEITRVIGLPDVNERLVATGHRVIAGTSQQLADKVRRDIEKTRQIMRDSGMQQQE
jgi:tripartite-type tricarboxylate transporter receptor subunit TctC